MSSRLDRLLLLLELGSTASIRKSAAEQLGEVQKLYPHELNNLLDKVHAYLMSSQWETRVAASQAIAAIIRNIPAWNPTGQPGNSEATVASHTSTLKLANFSLSRVLSQGIQLTTRDHRAFEQPCNPEGLVQAATLAEQKRLLNKKLGLDIPVLNANNNNQDNNNNNQESGGGGAADDDDDDLVDENDLIPEPSAAVSSVVDVKGFVEGTCGGGGGGGEGSAVEGREGGGAGGGGEEDRMLDGAEEGDVHGRKRKHNDSTLEPHASKAIKMEEEFEEQQASEWPLSDFCSLLANNLFSVEWERRHGAALGLKVLIKQHGASAGKSTKLPPCQMEEANSKWLEDLSVRLICVLSLDRLGDYLTDEVIAPVRESCAQVLGVVCLHLKEHVISDVSDALLQLLSDEHEVWEVKHGGLLGIKYILATRQDLSGMLLGKVLPHIHEGLLDPSDDVRSVAASSLLPVVEQLVRLTASQVTKVMDSLWDTLKHLDELSSSTNSVMRLISLLISHPHIYRIWHTSCLSQLLPLLYPFISHNITSVRTASLTTINVLLAKSLLPASTAPAASPDGSCPAAAAGGAAGGARDGADDNSCAGGGVDDDSADNLKSDSSPSSNHEPPQQQQQSLPWIQPLMHDLSRLIFQRSLLENEPSILLSIQQVWDKMMVSVSDDGMVQCTGACFGQWCLLLMQPEHLHFDLQALVNVNPNRTDFFRYVAGVSNVVDSVQEKDELVVRARLTAASLLGKYCFKVANIRSPEPHSPQQPQAPTTQGTTYDKGTAVAELGQLLCSFLSSKSFLQRFAACNVVYYWVVEATNHNVTCACPASTIEQLKACLSDPVYYDELAHTFTRLQTEAKAFISTLHSWNLKLGAPFDDTSTLLSLEHIQQLCKSVGLQEGIRQHLSAQSLHTFSRLKVNLESSLAACSQTRSELTNRVQCSIASVLVELGVVQGLSNPIIRPLMHSIKNEHNTQLQERSGLTLSKLVGLMRHNEPCPNVKVVKNLVSMLLLDQKLQASIDKNADRGSRLEDILVLKTRRPALPAKTRKAYRRHNDVAKREPGVQEADKVFEEAADAEARQKLQQQRQEDIQRKGSMHALSCIVATAASHLATHVPSLYNLLFHTLPDSQMLRSSNNNKNKKPNKHLITNNHTNNNEEEEEEKEEEEEDAKLLEVVKCLQVLDVVLPSFDACLRPQLLGHFPHLLACLSNKYSIVRHLASRCLATIFNLEPVVTMDTIVMAKLLPSLRDSPNDYERMGAVEAVSMVIEELNIDVVPYIVSLVLPLLGAMSDCNVNVRLVATYSFAVLVRLMPLDNDCEKKRLTEVKEEVKEGEEQASTATELLQASSDLDITPDASMEKRRREDRGFLEQLLNPRLVPQFQVPVPLNVQLRKYQQDGVNWLSFLSRYKLHGILCDDMGLGKTLQSLCILVSDHYSKEKLATQNPSLGKTPPSIVITPPTLTSHWLFEVEKAVSSEVIKPLHYVGIPAERIRLQKHIGACNLVVASYDVVRNDIDFLSKIRWNYCILDEGHIIKNNKTKMSKAIKQLQSQHRLVLSGTPIQNNVLELWSLFDFLMPGFLGEEKQFQATFGRPILLSRDSKSSPKEQEAGALALEALHRQVLPFMLRRLKEDVLKDLPPKIMQDYYCDLSPLQVRLYEDFSRMQKDSIQNVVEEEEEEEEEGEKEEGKGEKEEKGKKTERTSHIFQALQYLRKVCNHPALALQRLPSHINNLPNIHDISHATKLVTLKQLLNDCGIGVNNNNNSGSSSTSSSSSSSSYDVTSSSVVSQHRVILFCQMKIMLDIIERDLFRGHMPSVSYLRLDGSVPTCNRHQIVHRFNNDPSIDVLLLSTQVGGLGLNLTGADTVIFYDHDWNPMKDLQAMDRAHRIGQKKVVTVYRLITRGTLEEKIMGLQRFKMNIAQSVINQDNHSLRSMGSNQLLDLFCLGSKAVTSSGEHATSSSSDSSAASASVARGGGGDHGGGGGENKKGVKAVLEDIGQLWDCNQYEQEYDLDAYVKSYASK